MDHLPVGLDIYPHPGPCPGPASASDVAFDGHSVRNGHVDNQWCQVEKHSDCLQELCHFEPASKHCAFHQFANGLHVALKNDVDEHDGRGGRRVPPASGGVFNGFAATSATAIASNDNDGASLEKHSEALLPANANKPRDVAGSKAKVPSSNAAGSVMDVEGEDAGAKDDGGSGGRRSGGREQDGVRAWFVCATALLNYAIGT